MCYISIIHITGIVRTHYVEYFTDFDQVSTCVSLTTIHFVLLENTKALIWGMCNGTVACIEYKWLLNNLTTFSQVSLKHTALMAMGILDSKQSIQKTFDII